MKEMELKHIVGYLPYGLRFISELDTYDECQISPKWTCNGITMLFGDYCLNNVQTSDAYPMHLCKPVLHPLSDLTKEIEVNGEKFVPIDRLNENGFTKYSLKYINFVPYLLAEYIAEYNILTPNCAKEKLFEWHFDIFSLLENNLAIDINTLKNEA